MLLFILSVRHPVTLSVGDLPTVLPLGSRIYTYIGLHYRLQAYSFTVYLELQSTAYPPGAALALRLWLDAQGPRTYRAKTCLTECNDVRSQHQWHREVPGGRHATDGCRLHGKQWSDSAPCSARNVLASRQDAIMLIMPLFISDHRHRKNCFFYVCVSDTLLFPPAWISFFMGL